MIVVKCDCGKKCCMTKNAICLWLINNMWLERYKRSMFTLIWGSCANKYPSDHLFAVTLITIPCCNVYLLSFKKLSVLQSVHFCMACLFTRGSGYFFLLKVVPKPGIKPGTFRCLNIHCHPKVLQL